MARPEIPIDWKTVDNLCKIQCTGEEIASVLNVSYDTLERRIKKEFNQSCADYIAEKRQGGKASLRRAQWKLATEDKGNATMLIWLGKQYLNQKDTPVDGDSTKPVTINIVNPNGDT